MVKTYSQLYLGTRKALLTQEDEASAGRIARDLLCHIAGKSREYLLANGSMYAGETVCDAMKLALERLLDGEPLAYVLEEWEFYGMTLYVNKNVLIPRDDTCAVAELAIKNARAVSGTPRVLDLCAGSGCIGLAVAKQVQSTKVTLGDISREALAVARKNISLQKLTGRVSCLEINALEKPEPFLGKFDLIVSNPPYITTEEMKGLPESVKDHEPHLALHGGTDGLDFYRAIAENYRNALKIGGVLCFEFGMGQGDDVCRILENKGFTVLERTEDYNHIERAVSARLDREDVE